MEQICLLDFCFFSSFFHINIINVSLKFKIYLLKNFRIAIEMLSFSSKIYLLYYDRHIRRRMYEYISVFACTFFVVQ